MSTTTETKWPLFVGYDTETHLIEPGRLVPPVVCLTLAAPAPLPLAPSADIVLGRKGAMHTALITRGEVARVWGELLDAVKVGGVVAVAHNAPFDLAVLAAEAYAAGDDHAMHHVFELLRRGADAPSGRPMGGHLACTKIREKLLAIHDDRMRFDPKISKPAKFDLTTLALRWLGVDLSAAKTGDDVWRLRYSELDGVPAVDYPEAAASYVIEDAVYALEVWSAQATPRTGDAGYPLVDERGVVTDEGPQLAAAWALHLCSVEGLTVDAERAKVFEAEVQAKVAEARALAVQAGFMRPNGSKDMKAFRARVEDAYAAQGRHVPLTDKGATSTAREVLVESGDPVLVGFAKLGPYEKLLSTYVPQLHLGVINHGLECLGAETSRTSAYKPNTQNPPRKGGFRECFIAAPGFVMCSVDFDAAELKTLAQVQLNAFGTSTLADAFAKGQDPHLRLGARLLGARLGRTVDYAEAEAALADEAHPLHRQVKDSRQFAKVANFGFPGGLGALAFQAYAKGYGLVLSDEEAVQIREDWFAEWAEMRAYFEGVGRLTEHGGACIVSEVTLRQHGGRGFTQTCNILFQAYVADFAKRALFDVQYEGWTGLRCDGSGEPSPLAGARAILFIHDEVIALLPEGPQTHEAAERMAEVMRDAGNRYVPDVEITASPALMRRWYKDAKAVYRDGRLVPWEPKPEELPVEEDDVGEEDEAA